MDTQKAAFVASPSLARDQEYFRAKIGTITTAEELVSDRRLLGVALGAFGLDADINNKFFIRKVLEDGTQDTAALANRLADKQYRAFSAEFGFGDFAVPRTKLSDFADKILTPFKDRQFETAVGSQNGDMRLALNAEREMKTLATRTISDDTKWFTVMGNTALRQVFQKALGLPESFATIDLDQQLGVLKEKASRVFGSPEIGQFSEPGKLNELVRLFLIRSEAQASIVSSASGSVALQLLQNSPRGASLYAR
jgi:hypothetical protein